RAARASSSRLLRNWAKSSPSVIPPAPGATSAVRCWMTALNGLVGIDFNLAAIVSTSLSSERAVLIHQFDDAELSNQPPNRANEDRGSHREPASVTSPAGTCGPRQMWPRGDPP